MKVSNQKIVGLLVIFSFMTSVASPLVTEAHEKGSLGLSANTRIDVDFDDDDLPKGIQHAPGIKKRVEDGKGFPKGILKKLFKDDDRGEHGRHHDDDDDHDDDSDHHTSEIQIVRRSGSVTDTSATFSFETNVQTEGSFYYSTDSDLNSKTEIDLTLDTDHNVVLDNLEPETRYYFRFELTTEDNTDEFETRTRSFVTKATDNTSNEDDVDVDGPNILFFHTFDVETNSVNLIWLSSESSDAQVWISTNADVETTGDPVAVNTDLKIFHLFELDELEADTEYFIKVSSTDESGNTTFSETISFTTDTA